MSDRIRLLPDVVANQIAAGEVVNRPSSVVKEMMENSVDAGARHVTVNSRDGGRELIQIVDDGCGMSPVDARMAFDRHATSKISTVDDIYALSTFGFRGEALASIAAVAQVELRTRQPGDEIGTETRIDGGRFRSQQPVMCPEGSQFFVRNLFYNVPARRRFLDKSTASATQIKTEFQRVALCNPGVHFELYSNDAPVYNLPPASLAERIVGVVGRHIKQNLLEVGADTSIVKVEGYVGRPAAAKKSNSEQYFFVNGRYFNSPYFRKAVLKAYEKLIPDTCYPSYFIYMTIDPDRIDVNVHPQKTEVKFADADAVWQIVHAAVRETLAKTGAVPLMDFETEGNIDIPVLRRGAVYDEPRAADNTSYNPFAEGYVGGPFASEPSQHDLAADFDVPYDVCEDRPTVGRVSVPPISPSGPEMQSGHSDTDSELEFIPSMAGEAVQQRLMEEPEPQFGTVMAVGGGYAAALWGGRFVVADLQRARERVLYENYRIMLHNGSSVSQQLLFPERLVLSCDEYGLLELNETEFAAAGFDLVLLGAGEVEVRGVPAEMSAESADELIYRLLQIFSVPAEVDVRRERLATELARDGARCAAAIRSDGEAEALLHQLAQTGSVSFSPSGKPILAEITQEELRAKLRS